MKPVIGIRPIIDGRQGGIRESLEAQTMGMALTAPGQTCRKARLGRSKPQNRLRVLKNK